MLARLLHWLRHKRYAALALRLVVGLIFLCASLDKVVHPDRFAELMQDYDLLPRSAVNLAAVWLAWLEVVVGLMLVAGVWVRTAALLTLGLTGLFLGALAVALTRGVNLHCGCFSTDASGSPRAWASLWREGLLLLACVALLISVWPGSPSSQQTQE